MSSEAAKKLGAKGGKKRWEKVSKEERTKQMRELAQRRWKKG